MKKQHHIIQSLDFNGEWMLLAVDGQRYRIPTAQASPRLANASEVERKLYQVSPSGYGINWPILDEDLSIDGLLKLAEASTVETPA